MTTGIIRHALIFICLIGLAAASTPLSAAQYLRDITYAEVDGQELQLDLYLPESEADSAPLVVWIHGGAWRGGSRYPSALSWLSEQGYAVASISYRLSQQAPFPAQIHDCKGAIRWLRAHAEEYGYDADQVAVAGASAGGMLAALVGTSGDITELEGAVGGNLDQSSRVQAVIDYYGATDFILRSGNQPEKTDEPKGIVYKLLGGAVQENEALAKLASAAYQVSEDDPPLLVFHGERDGQVLPVQSRRIMEAYEAAGLPVEAHFLEHAGHGGGTFYHGEPAEQVLGFLHRFLPTPVPAEVEADTNIILKADPTHMTSLDSKENGGRTRYTLRRDTKAYLRLMPPEEGKNYTHLRLANQRPIVAGNYYRLTYETRVTPNEEKETGQGGLRLTLGALPKSGTGIKRDMIEQQSVAVVGSEWESFTFEWQAARDYAPGEFRIEFRPNYFRETMQVRDPRVVDLGIEAPKSERQGNAYPGHAADAPWRAEADERIREHRMADLMVEVVDEWGQPVEGAEVQIRMTGHDYLFGTCVKASRLTDPDIVARNDDFDREQFLKDNAIYREKLQELFNFAVFENDMKWRNWSGLRSERGWTQAVTLDAVDQLEDYDFAIKSHTMLWGSWRNSPAYLLERENDPEALRGAIHRHIVDQAKAFRGKVDYADVINEALSHNDLIEAVGWDQMAGWFKTAKEIMPETKLVINEFDILGNGGSEKRQDEHFALVERLLDEGAPIDVLGFQSHFWSTRLTPPERLYDIIERFAQFDLPMMVSEFDMNLLDEPLQADYSRDFLKLWFSHPATEAFLMWGFWANAHWFGEPGAMFRDDWSPKPNLKAYTDLVFGEWWTEADLQTAADGEAAARVFKGQYEITISAPGYHTATRRPEVDEAMHLPVVLYPKSQDQ